MKINSSKIFNSSYPTYFEIEWYSPDVEENPIFDGGFIYAESYTDAMHILEETYENIISVKIYQYDTLDFVLPLSVAQEIKAIIDKEAGYANN